MNTTILIAVNTFKETIRNKILYNILFFALGIILLSISFGEWSVFSRVQVMQDFGLATMSVAGLLLAIFIGVGMLGKEISSRTLYNVLVKPVERYQFVIGKWLGLLMTLFLNFAIMTGVFWIVIEFMGAKVNPSLLGAILLIWVELAVIVSVAILFSTMTTTMLAALFTLAFYLAGHYNDLIGLDLVENRNPILATILRGIYYLLPNLEHFNIRTRIIYELGLPSGFIEFSVLYGLLYTALFLLAACVIFEKRDL